MDNIIPFPGKIHGAPLNANDFGTPKSKGNFYRIKTCDLCDNGTFYITAYFIACSACGARDWETKDGA